MDDEWDWFEEVDDAEPAEPLMAAVLSAVRRSAGDWSRGGLTPDHTLARLDSEKLRLFIDLSDTERAQTLATLRVDIVPNGVCAMAWASASLAEIEPRIEDADPFDLVRFSATDLSAEEVVERVLGWVGGQLGRVIRRYDWRSDGEITATCYVLADKGLVLSDSGDAELTKDVSTADTVRQIRP